MRSDSSLAPVLEARRNPFVSLISGPIHQRQSLYGKA